MVDTLPVRAWLVEYTLPVRAWSVEYTLPVRAWMVEYTLPVRAWSVDAFCMTGMTIVQRHLWCSVKCAEYAVLCCGAHLDDDDCHMTIYG